MQNEWREVYSNDIACFRVEIGALERSIKYRSQKCARQKAIIVTIDDIDAHNTTYISFLSSEHSPLHFSFSEKSIEMWRPRELTHSCET